MAGPAYIDSFRLIRILPDDVIIAADAVDDTLTLVAGPGISLVANANADQLTIVNTNPAEFSLGVAGDDSSIKTISSGETIRFAGAQNITVTADSEGAITITGPDFTNPTFTGTTTAENISATGFLRSSRPVVVPNKITYKGTGVLTQITTAIATGMSPRGVAVDPTGRFVYVTNRGAFSLSHYSINQSTGELTNISTGTGTGDLPFGVAVDPTGRFVYVANGGNSTVSQYSINQTTGALTQITTAIATGSAPTSVAVDSTGRFVYVSNSSDNTVSQYSINQTTGALTQITTAIATGSFPLRITVDPTGRFVYVVNYSGGSVSQYSINQTTGALTQITTAIATGSNPYEITVDPIGRFVYVSNETVNTVSQYSINQTTGALTQITTAIATGTSPIGIAVDPTGRFVYVVNSTGNFVNGSVSQYSINNFSAGDITTRNITVSGYFEMSDGTSPQGDWTNFTPTWTAATSNPVVGDGLIEGRYKMVGKTVHVWMMMTMGSTTTFGTGEYKLSLPVPARAIASVVLDLVMYDNGTRHYNSLAHNDYTTSLSLDNTSVTLFWDTGVVTHSAPFTWTDGDWFIVSGTYEAS